MRWWRGQVSETVACQMACGFPFWHFILRNTTPYGLCDVIMLNLILNLILLRLDVTIIMLSSALNTICKYDWRFEAQPTRFQTSWILIKQMCVCPLRDWWYYFSSCSSGLYMHINRVVTYENIILVCGNHLLKPPPRYATFSVALYSFLFF